ncbi:hypothetical protein [Methylocella sp.]|jgi:hypothetical protein|uniref:hypothetical protein n=1 Tax=Methylocella sp. TaxID=1978226 RepID=UPI003C14F645
MIGAASPDEGVLEMRARATDAMLGPTFSNPEAAAMRRALALFKRYGAHAALAACVVGVAWMGHSYFSRPARTVASVESVEAPPATASPMAKEYGTLEYTKPPLDTAKTDTSSAIVELLDKVERVEHLQRSKRSEVSKRFHHIGHKTAALAAASVASHPASTASVTRKHAQGGRGDAFDPSRNPTAPGAPRPLGSLAPQANAM